MRKVYVTLNHWCPDSENKNQRNQNKETWKNMEIPQKKKKNPKLKIELPYYPAISLVGKYLEKYENSNLKDTQEFEKLMQAVFES